MKKDTIIKTIDYQRDLYNRFWNTLVVTITGEITLLFAPNTIYKWAFLFLGFIVVAIFISGCKEKKEYIEDLFKKLDEEK
jgi:hypothetical protein